MRIHAVNIQPGQTLHVERGMVGERMLYNRHKVERVELRDTMVHVTFAKYKAGKAMTIRPAPLKVRYDREVIID